MENATEIIEEGVFYIKNAKLGWNEVGCKHSKDKIVPHAIGMYDSGGGHEVCLECLLDILKEMSVITLMSGVIKALDITEKKE